MEKLIFPDGSALTAIRSLTLSQSVNDGSQLSLGSACAASLEASVVDPEGRVTQGTRLTLVSDDSPLGVFLCEKPRRTGADTVTFTAYDPMILLDRDISRWLSQALPDSTLGLVEKLCAHCGVELTENPDLPGADLPVEPFDTQSVTGRQLLRWIGQRDARFFRMDENGRLCPGWYTPSGETLGEEIPYRMDGLSLSEYQTAPAQRVLVRQETADVGRVYPDGSPDTANTYILQGNPLDPDPEPIYEQLKDFSYTPFRCALFTRVPALGSLVTLPDGSLGPVMERTLRDGIWTVSGQGSQSFQSTEAYNNLSAGALNGRMLTVERSVAGLKVAHKDAQGNMASLELDMTGLTSRVSAVERKAQSHAEASSLTAWNSQLTQRADSLEFSVTQLRTDLGSKADKSQVEPITERFRFDSDGLTISNSATGMGIGVSEQRIVFTGGSDPTTVIYPNRLETTHLHIGESLRLGTFSLFPRTNGNLSLRYTG